VRQLSTFLSTNPIREYRLIAQYYLVWCDLREAKYNAEALESIIENTRTYKTKALSSRAAIEVYKGRPDAAMYFYTEALKSSPTVSEHIHISRAVAVLKAQEGFHDSALKTLEGLIPLIRHAEPIVCYDVLNSYAAELSEAGRKEEARNVSRLVLASPFAFAYPEWQETANELGRSQGSSVFIDTSTCAPRNVLFMPLAERASRQAPPGATPARVLDLQKWKMKMGRGKMENSDKQKPVAEMNTSDMLLRAMQVFSDRTIPEEKRRKMIEAIERILDEPGTPKPDNIDLA
jgi:tetratricopeptide (TPR) repeat protein